MDAARRSPTLTLGSTAGVAQLGPRLDIALCDLVPPLLLRGAPDLLLLAGGAAEDRIDVGPAGDERRDPVAVVRSECLRIAGSGFAVRDRLVTRVVSGTGRDRSRRACPAVSQDLRSALLAALHRCDSHEVERHRRRPANVHHTQRHSLRDFQVASTRSAAM